MDSKGIEYTIVDLSTNKAAVEYVTEDLGYSQAPVVVSDFSPHIARACSRAQFNGTSCFGL